MRPERSREAGPGLSLRHSFTEDEAPHLISKLLYLFRIGGGAKAFRQSEECLLLFPVSFQALFDQFNQNPVVAEAFFFWRCAPPARLVESVALRFFELAF